MLELIIILFDKSLYKYDFVSEMPQLKTPPTLYNAALSETRLLIVQHALQINRNYSNFKDVRCQEAIQQFNQYLNTCIPSHIIDDLYNSTEIFSLTKSERFQMCICEKQATPDPKIVIALYLNKNMKILNAYKIVHDGFWKSTLTSLEKLIKLDLNKVCTDEILEVVGKHCKNLEFVNIVSKSCHTRRKDRHNALKLQLCVSDVGLDHLSNCKRLKDIRMTSIIRKGCGGRQVTNEGIKRLVLSLPELRRINYTDTGLLFQMIPEEVKKLSLVSLCDNHPEAARIFQIEFMCPHLTELDLTHPYLADGYGSQVIAALCNSELKISILSLTNFSFDFNLKKYLEVKGTHLKVFNFTSSFVASVDELLRLLGWTCPDLEKVMIRFHVFYSITSYSCPLNNLIYGNKNKQFCNLKTLSVNGVCWDSSQVLPLVLKNATFIKHIIINNHRYTCWLDEPLKLIKQTNSLLHLETVSFLNGFKIELPYLKTFVMSCPVLRNITVETESQDFFDQLVQFRQDLLSANYDVNIDVYCT